MSKNSLRRAVLLKLVVVDLTAKEIIELLKSRIPQFNPTIMVGESYLDGVGLYFDPNDQVVNGIVNNIPAAMDDFTMVLTCVVSENTYLWKYVKSTNRDVKASAAARAQANTLFK